MIQRFLSLEWKQFTRASYFQKGIAIKILLFFAAIYFGSAAVFLGIGVFFIAEKLVPSVDPVITVNNFLIYWFLISSIF